MVAPHNLQTCHISCLRVHHTTIVETASYEGNREITNTLGLSHFSKHPHVIAIVVIP